MRNAKVNLVILAAAAAGVLWIEHSHRIKIEMSTLAESLRPDAAICPENESVPFSADCLMFIAGAAQSEVHQRVNAAGGALPESPELP